MNASVSSRLRYRGIIDQLPAVLYVDGVNEDEPMIDVSPSVIDLLGIPREQFLSRPYAWADTIHPEDLDRVLAESERDGPAPANRSDRNTASCTRTATRCGSGRTRC